MTDVAPTPSNAEIEAQAAALLRRQCYETWSDNDQMCLTRWLEESPSHKAAYWRLKAAWEQTERLAALRLGVLRRTDTGASRTFSNAAKGAIAVGAIAAVIAAVTFWGDVGGQLYTTGVGGRTTIRLADGSELDLGTDTEIRTHFSADRRSVEVLKGEILFRVTHNEAQPFVVHAGNSRVVDLGTEFLVRKQPERVQVSLIEGEAKFETTGIWPQERSVTLHPGDVVLATANSFDVSRKTARELSDELGWRRGVLIFHNTRLDEAAAEFNRYNQTKLIVGERKIAALTINGTFRTNGFEQFARVTRDVFGLRIEHGATGIVLNN